MKPLVGHCQAAAAVEMMATIYAFQTGYVPAPPRVAPGHPRLVDGRTPRGPGPMVKSSIGMGGYNTAVVCRARIEPRHPPSENRHFHAPEPAASPPPRIRQG